MNLCTKKTRPNPMVEKPNTSSPIKVKELLNSSDIIYASSLLLHHYILRTHTNLRKPRNSNYALPGPRLFNSLESAAGVTPSSLPSIEEIQAFIQAIFDKRRLPGEAGIIALILLSRTSIKLHSQNWMRLVLIALLLANKQCEDVYSVYNAKFLGIIPNLENLEINVLELEFLKIIKYRLFIDTDTYLRYYGKLQKFFPEEGTEIAAGTTTPAEEEISYTAEPLPPVESEEISETAAGSSQEDEMIDICCQPPVSINDCGSLWEDFNFDLVGSLA